MVMMRRKKHEDTNETCSQLYEQNNSKGDLEE